MAFRSERHRFTLLAVFVQNRSLIFATAVLVCAIATAGGCERAPPKAATVSPIQVRAVRTARHRILVAAATIRFAHSSLEPGTALSGYDRLQVDAVFADADRRDGHLVDELTGHIVRRPRLPEFDTCIRQAGPLAPNVLKSAKPRGHMQLLDVGNLVLRSGKRELPLRISMVPSLFSAIRGVRYDADIDNARDWLAVKWLMIEATGGDGVPGFRAEVNVPRPVRFTRVGGRPVRAGHVIVSSDTADLDVRWGTVDGAAMLEIIVGAERGKGLDWVRCRLRDDGAFMVPKEVLAGLPERSARRPWLISLIRTSTAQVPGFRGRPLRLELVDSVRVR
jgi:hypothetical protein